MTFFNKILKAKNSLYWKISGFFLLTLLLLGVAYVIITVSIARRYYDETTQRLNAHVAEHMLTEVNPFVDGKVNEEALGKIMHSMMAVNPGLEVYLLNPAGEILSYVVLEEEVRLKNVSMDPVRDFLVNKGERLIYGDDPKNPGRKKIFSATAVREGDKLLGYVYMILASEEYENIAGLLQGNYLLKMGSIFFAFALIAALVIGLVILWMLMKNLNDIIKTVKKFEEGDLTPRIPLKKDGELTQLAATINNMADTILKNMDELKEVDTLRRELVANISHDIRTPISIIHGYIETLIIKQHDLSPEKREEYLQTILKSTDRLKKLMNDLFELSKLEARQIKPNIETFFIVDLLQDITRKYQLLALEKNIHLVTEINSETAMVKADLSMIERVIQNLMDNALKFTPRDGMINVQMVNQENKVKISISNSGANIPDGSLNKIFDRYYKTDEQSVKFSQTTSNKGAGLGLAIVKNILEIHETDIFVKTDPSKKITFSFSLPAASETLHGKSSVFRI